MSRLPVLLICMGVSGSGKSTVARYLASELGLKYFEADDFHSDEGKALMAAGIPLNDEQREPWINRMCAVLRVERQAGSDCTLAYSGLRKQHRQRFREIGFRTMFVFLRGDSDTIAGRMASREGHFMSAEMLASQLQVLQSTEDEPDVTNVENAGSLALTLATSRSIARSFIEQDEQGQLHA